MILLITTSIIAIYGILTNSPEAIAIAGIIYFFVYPFQQYKKSGITSISPVSLYSIMKGLASLGNFVGLFSAEDPILKAIYFKYLSTDHILLASTIHYIGSVITIFGFEAGLKKINVFGKISYNLSQKQIAITYPLIVFSILFVNYLNFLPQIGSLTNFLKIVPVGATFFYARYGTIHSQNKYINLAFVFMFISTFHAVLYSFLRTNMVLPPVAFILGILIGDGSLKSLKKPILYPIYFGMFIFLTYFTFLGKTRTSVGTGFERIQNYQSIAESQQVEEEGTFLSRCSNINQLSQIGRIADEDGFYYGETIAYLVYGFIPRFIWPDKPIIQQGAWFAYRIGQGRILNGKYTNSIDMSASGELYLNFGWFGLVIGTFLLGYLFGLMWMTTNFWESETNILGNLFGFYLLFLGLFSFGADLQIILTLIATFLSFLILNKLLGRGAVMVVSE